jgi:hypothetical protein
MCCHLPIFIIEAEVLFAIMRCAMRCPECLLERHGMMMGCVKNTQKVGGVLNDFMLWIVTRLHNQ